MKSGPKTTSNKLKVLQGVNNKQRLNEDEPIVCDKDLRRPSWVEGYAREVWDRLSPELVRIGVLKFVDRDIFGSYCVVVKDIRDAEKAGDVGLKLRLFQQLRLLGNEFGCSPAGRANIHVPKGDGGKGNNKKTKLFGRE